MHSLLVALGIAAIIVSFPLLFEVIRWLGIAYLLFLAFHLLKAVFKSQSLNLEKKHTDHPIRKGFLTALLNPKGMLIYFAILLQFMTQTGNTVAQGFILSCIFIGLIFVVYCSLSLLFAKISQKTQMDAHRQKCFDGVSGTLLMLAATWLMTN